MPKLSINIYLMQPSFGQIPNTSLDSDWRRKKACLSRNGALSTSRVFVGIAFAEVTLINGRRDDSLSRSSSFDEMTPAGCHQLRLFSSKKPVDRRSNLTELRSGNCVGVAIFVGKSRTWH